MSNTFDPNKFRYDSNYNPEASFTRIKYGHDKPVLETELNEMQILQEKARTSMMRRLIPSGFIELVKKEFVGAPIVYNPLEKSMVKLNHIAMAPAKVMINGYELTLESNFSVNENDNYIDIDLGTPPETGTREDFVFLEVWFEEFSALDNIRQYGYSKGALLGYQMVDPRVNEETSRRIALCWNIKVAHGVNFEKHPDGFGYFNINDKSIIKATANGRLGTDDALIFANARHDLFKACEFYKDNNLWVAGRPDYTMQNVYGNYVFGLPLFKVKRRNKVAYSIDNFNGSPQYSTKSNIGSSPTTDSSVYGDLAHNIRPDKLYHDYIVESDLVDLRRSIAIKELERDYYLDKNLKSLFKGKLQTKDTKQMRRVQFGNIDPDYTNENVIFISKFNKDIKPSIPGNANPMYSSTTNEFVFKDSVSGYGLFMDGSNSITYTLYGFNKDECTIDFFMQPFWHGADDVDQSILEILDEDGNKVYTFHKNNQQLVFSQYYDRTDSMVNSIMVDLKSNLMFAKNIYHIRLSWTNNVYINQSYIYINGKLCAQGPCVTSTLIPNKLQLGKVETLTDGFVIEDLIVYKKAFEMKVTENNYQFIKNEYWPNLPKDFVNSNTLIYSSFNSLLNYFGDSQYEQTDLVTKLHVELDSPDKFKLTAPSGRQISTDSPKVYDVGGNAIAGTWTNLGTPEAVFTSGSAMDDIIVQYNLNIPGGNGGYDLPSEILAAAMLIDDSIKEVSFNRKDNTVPKKVDYIKPRITNNTVDKAYDFSTNRGQDQCFARLLYYYKDGNGTNKYSIPMSLYGYEVIGVMGVTNKKITKCTKIKDNIDNRFEVEFDDKVLPGTSIEFELALGGFTFDYDIHNKTLMTDLHKTKILEIVSDGMTTEYVLPLFQNETVSGSILKSVLTYKDNIYVTNEDGDKELVARTPYSVCFVDSEMFEQYTTYDTNSQPIKVYKPYTYEIQENSFGTPFLRIKIVNHLNLPIPSDARIQIPVMVSYQPKEDDILSIWYNHIPYQGLLSSDTKNLKRISEWKYFMTSLSSGNVSLTVDSNNIYSLNNIVNRLPGGASFAYTIDGQDLKLKHLLGSLVKTDVNTKLVFTQDVILAATDNKLDDSFFVFDTDYNVYKNSNNFQDGKLTIKDTNFKMYLPICEDRATKYVGMASLVIDEKGEVLLFIVGCLNNKVNSEVNELIPVYGDLFRLENIPTTISY